MFIYFSVSLENIYCYFISGVMAKQFLFRLALTLSL